MLAGVVVCAAHQLLPNAKQESICMNMAMEKMADTPRIFQIVSISAAYWRKRLRRPRLCSSRTEGKLWLVRCHPRALFNFDSRGLATAALLNCIRLPCSSYKGSRG